MKKLSKRDWAVEILVCAALVACAGAAAEAACGGAQDVAAAPDPRFSTGLGLCVADVALAKEAMRKSDAGIDKPKLYDRYEACTRNNEAFRIVDAGGR